MIPSKLKNPTTRQSSLTGVHSNVASSCPLTKIVSGCSPTTGISTVSNDPPRYRTIRCAAISVPAGAKEMPDPVSCNRDQQPDPHHLQPAPPPRLSGQQCLARPGGKQGRRGHGDRRGKRPIEFEKEVWKNREESPNRGGRPYQ